MLLSERIKKISDHISRYNLETGEIWGKSGKLLNSKNSRGYITIGGPYVNKKPISCLAHQLIYFLATGETVEGLDHIDQDRANNSIHNLRKSSKRFNRINSLSYINSKGYSFCKERNKYRVQITVNSKRINGGYFEDEKDAICEVIRLRDIYDG